VAGVAAALSVIRPGEEGKIEVVRAKYGARASFCNAEPFFVAECDGKTSCEVPVDPNVCPGGVDPMEGVTKKLTVKYACGNKLKTIKALDRQRVTLNCSGQDLAFVEEIEFIGRTFTAVSSDDPGCGLEMLREGPDPDRDPSATCRELCVEVPLTAEIKHVDGAARRANKMKWNPCGNTPETCYPMASFYNEQRVESGNSVTKICWTFRNWNPDVDREAKLTVQYLP